MHHICFSPGPDASRLYSESTVKKTLKENARLSNMISHHCKYKATRVSEHAAFAPHWRLTSMFLVTSITNMKTIRLSCQELVENGKNKTENARHSGEGKSRFVIAA